MKRINALLVFLISSLIITGISCIDGLIWDFVFYATGMASYAIVGVLFSVGIILTRKQGAEAYAVAFFLLIVAGFGVYRALEEFRNWLMSWPLAVKIIVPIFIGAILIVGIILTIRYKVKNKEKLKEENSDDEDK